MEQEKFTNEQIREDADEGPHRFMDVDLIDFLGKIAEKVIVHYPNDWNIDKDALRKTAESDNPEKGRLVWHVCSFGTHLNTERDVFIKDSGPFEYMSDYRQNDPDMFGYIVEITGQSEGAVTGNVFEVGDYAEYAKHIRETALPLDSVTLTYSDAWGVNEGKEITVSRKEYDDDRHRLMSDSGDVVGLRWHPADENQLTALLQDERAARMSYQIGNEEAHQKKIAAKLAEIRGETPEPEKTPSDPVKAAKSIIGQTAIVTNAQKGKTYTGEIVLAGGEYAVQKIGPDSAVIHSLNKIADPKELIGLLALPKEDRRVSISYDEEHKASVEIGSRYDRGKEHETSVCR